MLTVEKTQKWKTEFEWRRLSDIFKAEGKTYSGKFTLSFNS